MLVDGKTRATFAAGVVSTAIEFILNSKPVLHIELVETSLEVTWFIPTRNVRITYASEQAAQHASDLFDNKMVKDTKLRSTIKKSEHGDIWSAQISNVPEFVDDSDIKDMLQEDAEVINIRSGKLSYYRNIPDLEILDKKVESITRKDTFASILLTRQNLLKYRAEFKLDGCPRLDGVARQLDGERVQEFGGSKIFAIERLFVRLSLQREVYELHAKRLKYTASTSWKEHKVQVKINDDAESTTAKKRVVIEMRATDRMALTSAKAMLDGVFTREMSHLLPRPPKPTTQTHRIRLPKTKAYRHAIKNIDRIKGDFGPDVVKLDDDSEPPAVIVTGDTEVLRNVQKLLFPEKALAARKTAMCTICWDESDDYIEVAHCEHTACKECFVGYCMVENEAKFPLRCFEKDCDQQIGIPQLQSTLKKNHLQLLFSQALTAHVERHPEEYVQCPGADCSMYYSISTAKEQHICPKCFTASCSDCRTEFHFDETCTQYQTRMVEDKDVEALEKWMEKEGAKRCTSCNAVVQKLVGCDNMQCMMCKVHFCWHCMKTFPTHNEVYTHLESEHGGFIADPEEREEYMRELREEEELVRALEEADVPVVDEEELAIGGIRRAPRALVAAIEQRLLEVEAARDQDGGAEARRAAPRF